MKNTLNFVLGGIDVFDGQSDRLHITLKKIEF